MLHGIADDMAPAMLMLLLFVNLNLNLSLFKLCLCAVLTACAHSLDSLLYTPRPTALLPLLRRHSLGGMRTRPAAQLGSHTDAISDSGTFSVQRWRPQLSIRCCCTCPGLGNAGLDTSPRASGCQQQWW